MLGSSGQNLLLLVLGLVLATVNAGSSKWSYHLDSATSPEKWSVLYPDQCGSAKKRQSPIDIDTDKATFYDGLDTIAVIDNTLSSGGEAEPEATAEVEVENGKEEVSGAADQHAGHHDMAEKETGKTKRNADALGMKTRKMSLFNNGHTAQADVEEGDIFFASKALGKEYKVAQVHFHWGKNGSAGSEHRLNGQMYHLEMHIVTYDSETYASLSDAVGKNGGLAVFGVLFKKGKHNHHLSNVVNNLKNITKPVGREGKVPIEWFDITQALPASLHKYYRYEGSLTTPTCDETVIWTIFAEHPTVCPSQLKQFYSLREGRRADGEPVQLENNYRPPQPLNDRQVSSSFILQEKAVKYNVVQGDDQDNIASSIKCGFSSLILSLCLTWIALRA